MRFGPNTSNLSFLFEKRLKKSIFTGYWNFGLNRIRIPNRLFG